MSFELPIITIDIDWAPDWIIDEVATILMKNRIKATWFVTHRSSMIERLRSKTDLFELGLHPNCFPESSHGKSEEDVLSHVKKLVPEAVSMRSHGLYQSFNFLKMAAEKFGIKNDASIILPGMDYIKPFTLNFGSTKMNRIPYYWEDDLTLLEKRPSWNLLDLNFRSPGLKIFNFHPVHIILNTKKIAVYEELKLEYPLCQWTPEIIKRYRWKGKGPKSLFLDIVDMIKQKGARIRDLVSVK